MRLEDQIYQSPEVQNALDRLDSCTESQCSQYEVMIDIDNLYLCGEKRRFIEALDKINTEQTAYIFEFSGDVFRPDLRIISARLKAIYDKLPKTKTYRDLLAEAYNKYGLKTDFGFHIDLDRKITDQEYSSQLRIYEAIDQEFREKIDEDDSDDDL